MKFNNRQFLRNIAFFSTLVVFLMHIGVQQVSSADQSFCKENPGAPGCQPKPKPKYKPKTKQKQSTPRKKYKGLKNTIRNDNTKKTYKSLQQAINEARKGHLIVIGPGTYEYDQTINVYNKEDLIIAGTDDGDDNAVSAILNTNRNYAILNIENSSDIMIHDLYFGHSIEPYERCANGVIYIDRSRNVYILNNEIEGSGVVGITAIGSNKITIENNLIHNNQKDGIELISSSNINIYSNTIADNYYSVSFNDMNGYLSIKWNRIFRNNINEIFAYSDSDLDALKINYNYFEDTETAMTCSACYVGGGCLTDYNDNEFH